MTDSKPGRSNLRIWSSMIAVGLIPILLTSCGGSGAAARSGSIDHVVLCWMKNPGSREDRQLLIASAEQLRTIPGVLSVSAGPPLMSDRDVVDDSFDVGFVITLESPEALEGYLAHPTHLEALKNILRPLVAKTLIYDIVVD